MSEEFFDIKLHKGIYEAMKKFLSPAVTNKKKMICQFLPNQVLRVCCQPQHCFQEDKSQQISLQKLKKFILKIIKKTNIVKIKISDKIISRITNMKQWKSNIKDQNVIIIKVQDKIGCFFLAGLTSLKNLNNISNQFELKSYKKFLTKYKDSFQNRIILENLLQNLQFQRIFYDTHSVSDLSLFQNNAESKQSRLKIKCQTQYYIPTQALTEIFHDLIGRLFCSFTIFLKLKSDKQLLQKPFLPFQNICEQFKENNIQCYFYSYPDVNKFAIGIIGSVTQVLAQKQPIFQKIKSNIYQDFQVLQFVFTKGFKLTSQIKNCVRVMIQGYKEENAIQKQRKMIIDS